MATLGQIINKEGKKRLASSKLTTRGEVKRDSATHAIKGRGMIRSIVAESLSVRTEFISQFVATDLYASRSHL